MYRLMVVEDEDMIRKGIVNSIPWQSLGFTVVAESANGKDALEQLEKNPVDVLLTDIKMPIMGGTELSKKTRQLYPDIEIIILSGFAEFEYARQAIGFRAFDYLLKPTNKKKLLDTFAELKESMDQKREMREEVFYSNLYISAGYETMRNEFLQSMLEGDTSLFNDFDEKITSLELDFSGHYFTAATIKFDRKSIFKELESSWATDKRLLTFSYRNILKEELSNIDNAYYMVKDYDTIDFIFCFSSMEEQNAQMIPCLESISENIHNCLFKYVTVPYTIGIGLSYPSIHHIAKSYNQAKRSIQNNFYLGNQRVQIYQDNNESKYEQNFIRFYPEEMELVVASISNGSYADTKKYLTSMFQMLIEQNLLPEIVKNYCVALKLMVQSKITNSYEVLEKIIGDEYNDFVKEALNVKELEAYIVNVMVALAKEIDQTVDPLEIKEQHKVIDKAKAYIAAHLSEKITLKMISENVYLSETYFSFLFKKITGVTYIDYIQKLRMQEAKKLLVNTNYKVYKVAELIGYSDYKYFSVQFKKYVALTPKEYRNQGRREVKP
ncbi:AraC family two component transcriptional regulator [Mobilisporobacter senegalensis]|uniref:Stage 0 sporulation protein A homolog n=1 Tax=Mobilisporobacter senegalensis TaxID=1329262 RepID=A0A3N1XYY8_9FIRM|nr:response regulator [Mobilisporobacter senegalensis]ROR30452.1 AraC family two component transcriptional regulator [Mobilisporobacter senegalensis]